jgi:hypothetical protein
MAASDGRKFGAGLRNALRIVRRPFPILACQADARQLVGSAGSRRAASGRAGALVQRPGGQPSSRSPHSTAMAAVMAFQSGSRMPRRDSISRWRCGS